MTKSKPSKISLTTKLADSKSVKIAIKLPKTYTARRLDDMNQDELRHEIDGLPHRIEEARKYRDKLMGALKERWSTAYVNDQDFVTAYARAEAAGAEAVALMERAVKASRLWYQRYSGKLL